VIDICQCFDTGNQSALPRAIALDAQENLWVACASDGVLRILDKDCGMIDDSFASSLDGAVSQAFAPQGLFHGNLFVACGDRVMEVDVQTGESTVFMANTEAYGIAFDPEGSMYVSQPSQDRILKIVPGLPGDMNGDTFVNIEDLPGFVEALLRLPDAPLPILTADMNCDGCANGDDIQSFIDDLFNSTIHAPCTRDG